MIKFDFIQGKAVLLFMAVILIGGNVNGEDLTFKTNFLKMKLNEKGEVTTLENTKTGKNYIAPSKQSYLLECYLYGEGSKAADIRKTEHIRPKSMKVLSKNSTTTKLLFEYDNNISATVAITPNSEYIQMKLIDIKPLNKISHITWGPIHTTMHGPVAEWLGLNRSEGFTVGMISLDVNTDGEDGGGMSFAANYEGNGSKLALWALDHTKAREFKKNIFSTPIPGVTVIGSSAALFGVPRGKKNELDIIEKIELKENLPHPTYHGIWQKRSLNVQKICLWTNVQESNADDSIKLAEAMHAGTLCRFHGFFRNWGHFDIDLNMWPGGIESYKKYSQLGLKHHIGMSTYTLTGFTKPKPKIEPFIAPIPDKRLAAYKPGSELSNNIDKSVTQLKIKDMPHVEEIIKEPGSLLIKIDNELIKYTKWKKEGDNLVIKNAKRGFFFTTPVSHKAGSKIKFIYFGGYSNVYPGTVDMNNEVADNIAKVTKRTGNKKIVLDGFESCLMTGHGTYSKNVFLKTLYKYFKGQDMLYSASNQDNFDWHTISYQSWGEFDMDKGFRGTMLDYRLMRQVQLRRNMMPNKMGQYYPEKADSIEDINWLMSLVVGWESGVDLAINTESFIKNPHCKEFCEKLRLWEDLRLQHNLTELQKLSMRQTDTIYDVVKDKNGKVTPRFVKYWINPKAVMVPSSEFHAKAGTNALVKPCTITWKWTHNPGIYYNCLCLSDDLVHPAGTDKSSWTVKYPAPGKFHAMFVLRLPEDAKAPIKNPKISFNGRVVTIPVTLQPGQYIATPHNISVAWIYNKNHKVIAEKSLPGYRTTLPDFRQGKKVNITLSYESVKQGIKPEVRVNLGATMKGWRKHSDVPEKDQKAFSLTTGKPATSSNHSDRTNLVNDGQKDDSFACWETSTTGKKGDAWWQVDLTKLEKVNRIVIATYFAPPKRYYQFTVETSQDGKKWVTTIDYSKNTKEVPVNGDGYVFNIPPTPMRYIRVNMLKHNHNNFVHLVEVMAYSADTKKK